MKLRTFGDKRSASLVTLCATAILFSLVCTNAISQGISVSGSGIPTYAIPIGVPPGVGDMAPSLGLQYSASGVNGPVGYGWNLQGISLITRCAGSKRIDGKAQSVAFNSNDKLCLDGQRLILTDATGTPLASQQGDSLGGSAVREYRTDKDSYSRIRAYGAAGDASNGPAYFKVWTKGGQIYEYGNAGNSAITVAGKTMVSVWAVNRISNTVGNYIDFKYDQRDVAWGSGPSLNNATPGREWQLKEVLYTGNALNQAVNRVVFDYTERPVNPGSSAQDRSESYHQGGKNVSVWLLDKVSTYINWPASTSAKPASAVHVKSLKLTYDRGPVTERSRLVSVRECTDVNLSKCLPATTFSYSDGGGLNYVTSPQFRNSALSTLVMHSVKGNYGVLTGNFFGDGRTSILRWSDTPSENQLFHSLGNGEFSIVPNGTGAGQFNLANQKLSDSLKCTTAMTADFNGDGLTDILRPTNSCTNAPASLFLSNGDGSFREVVIANVELMKVQSTIKEIYRCPDNWDECPFENDNGKTYLGTSRTWGYNYYVLDVNNDGILDFITAYNPMYNPTPAPQSNDQLCSESTCTRVFLGQANGTFVETLATNLTHVPMYTDPISMLVRDSYVADVNGDGLTDLVVNSGIWLSRGDGIFDFDSSRNSIDACAYGLDFNGDGRSDCLLPDYEKTRQKLMVSNGTYTQTAAGNFNLTGTGDTLLQLGSDLKQTAGIQIGDFDDDGRSDFIRWDDNPSINRVYLSNGDGTFRSRAFLNDADHQLQKSDESADFILGDFSGNGTIEILRLKAVPSSASEATRNQLYVKSNPMPPDQLTSVRTGAGITTSLTWVPMTNSASGSLGARYQSDRGTPNAATYPMVDVPPSGYVVATVTSDAGFGGAKQVTEYAYTGMKMAYDGRGWLGFRSNRIQNTAPNGDLLTVTSNNIQNGPNPGNVGVSETRLGALTQSNAPLLSRSTFIYCDRTAAAGAQAAATSSTPCATNAKVQRPYMYQSIEEGWDLQGTGLPKVTTTNVFNNDGDATEVLVVTASTSGPSQVSSKRATSEYHPANIDGDSWILGRLKKTTVFNDVTNSSLSLPTSAGSAPLATATVGTGADPAITPLVPSVNPAVLNQIIMLLLGDD